MTRTRRPSAQTAAVLQALAENAGRWRYGYDLCTQLGIQAGSMYPILMRLADRGLLETCWENDPAPGKPPRHLYRLTGAGPRLRRRGHGRRARPGPDADTGAAITAAAGRCVMPVLVVLAVLAAAALLLARGDGMATSRRGS